MKMLFNVTFPVEPFNSLVRDGTVGEKLKSILDEAKPEAVYFTEQGGDRSVILIVDVTDATRIPALSEPWFLTFEASVEVRIVMTPDVLAKAGLEELGRKWE